MTNDADFATLVAHLSDPRLYAEGGPVERVETHISAVFLTPSRAYKLLKPVDFGFLDFTTLAARRTDAEDEVRLNRRLAPDVYLRTVPITRRIAGIEANRTAEAPSPSSSSSSSPSTASCEGALPPIELDGPGEVVDWLVEMRRLPAEANWQTRIERGATDARDVEAVLDVLVPFLAACPADDAIAAHASEAEIRANALDNLRVLSEEAAKDSEEVATEAREPRHPRERDVVALRSLQLQWLATSVDLLDRRIRDGRIREGHGDLRAEHVYLTEPPAIVDCLEFNRSLRCLDVLDDVCFLAADLERLGRPDLAERLLTGYRRRADDPAPDELVAFYGSYRGAVRAKVACLRAREQDGVEREASFAAAAVQLRAAVRRLAPHVPRVLVVVGGPSGAGKSTVARAVAERIGAPHLASDVVRKSLFGLEPLDRGDPRRLYSREATERTYATLRSLAAARLADGASVVTEATFLSRGRRDAVRRTARESGVASLFVECRCPRGTCAARIAGRARRGDDASDADVAVLADQWSAWERLEEPPAERSRHVVLDATLPVERLVAQIVEELKSFLPMTGQGIGAENRGAESGP